jgi:hypothetical protein
VSHEADQCPHQQARVLLANLRCLHGVGSGDQGYYEWAAPDQVEPYNSESSEDEAQEIVSKCGCVHEMVLVRSLALVWLMLSEWPIVNKWQGIEASAIMFI